MRGAQASRFHARGHPIEIKLHTTPRDGAKHGEGEADAQGTGGRRTRRHHPVPAGDWSAGLGRQGGRWVCGWWRQAEVGRDPWTGELWGRQGPDCAGRGSQRGATGGGKADTGSRDELLGLPSRGRKRRLAVEAGRRGAVQVDGRSAPGRDEEGEACAKRERSSVDG